ncbi:hypothetical protein Z946_2373 [Sulfitobacter noctilucicola]|nr:hypothetical protein Z946_2373 [Sulfitobacter noctilucicola]
MIYSDNHEKLTSAGQAGMPMTVREDAPRSVFRTGCFHF